MKKITLKSLGIGLITVQIVWLVSACTSSEKPKLPNKTAEVGVVKLKQEKLSIVTDLPGRTSAYMVSEIRPQVGGVIRKRNFTEGAYVKAGDLLYQIEPAPFKATYDSAAAAVQKSEASLVTAKLKAERYKELVKLNAVSLQENDDAQAVFRQAEADLAVAKAAQQSAKINLDFTKVVSPISGYTSTSVVTPGALVTANQTTALTTVQQIDPIYLDLTQSSQALLQLKNQIAHGQLASNSRNELSVKAILEDGSTYQHQGVLKFSGVSVDASSGAVTLRAVFPNPDGLLMPGMYVHALLDQAKDDAGILVPQRSVTRNSRGEPTVLIVDEQEKVALKIIKVAEVIKDQWRVTSGLSAGDRVIVDGLQKVKVGDTVNVVADIAKSDTSPTSNRSTNQ